MAGSTFSSIGSLVGGTGSAAVSLVSGYFQRKAAKKLLAQNPYPTEGMPAEELANQQIAEGAATQGMPSEQYQQAQRNIQRNQAAQIAATAMAPGGAARNIGAIQQGSNDANANLIAQSAEMRRQNISQLLGVNSQVASWKDKLFDWNQRQKYIQNYNYGMSLLGQGNQNLMKGADKLVGTAAGSTSSDSFGGGGGGGGAMAASAAPAAYEYTPSLQDTGGGYSSAAQLFGGTLSTTAPNLLSS